MSMENAPMARMDMLKVSMAKARVGAARINLQNRQAIHF